jgi:hypothetical protein
MVRTLEQLTYLVESSELSAAGREQTANYAPDE